MPETTSSSTQLPALSEVIQALGCRPGDLKVLSAKDREDLKQWLADERAAESVAA